MIIIVYFISNVSKFAFASF